MILNVVDDVDDDRMQILLFQEKKKRRKEEKKRRKEKKKRRKEEKKKRKEEKKRRKERRKKRTYTVPDDNKSFESSSLTSSGLFLDRHNFHYFIFQSRCRKKPVNNF